MPVYRPLATILVCAVLLGAGARILHKEPIPLWGYPKAMEMIQPKSTFAQPSSVSPDSVFAPADFPYKVNLSEAMGLYMKRKKMGIDFIDTREHELYREGHITGAVNIPYVKLADYADSLERIPKDRILVLYCDGGECTLSLDLAEYLIPAGWKRVAVFEGGWAAWSAETDFVECSE